MLRRSFCHVPGIGPQAERALWKQGCSDWDDFLGDPDKFTIGSARREAAVKTVEASKAALETGNHQFFSKVLAPRDAWRAWPDFRGRCVYLDIETDGGMGGEAVTCVGLFDGKAFRCLVKDHDLYKLPDMLSYYSYVVTFFGTGFDLPMLQRCFPSLCIDQIHLDLCYALKRLGYRGGLKKIEKQFGISRSEESDGLGGQDAIRLWREHQNGTRGALDLLVEYNREDVVNLETLSAIAYEKLEAATVLGTL